MNRRIRIKICGITRYADAEVAVREGVDSLGFIFYEKGPRYIDPEEARLIIERIPPFVGVVGLFVDKKRNEVEEIVDYCRLTHVQLHGEESPKYCERLSRCIVSCQILKALRIGNGIGPAQVADYSPHVKGFVLDTYRNGNPGGTGESFDWSIIDKLNIDKPFLLAGGIGIDNVNDAIIKVKPFGVDANSALETEPGIKSHEKIKSFISMVRKIEGQLP